eukprot:CAMPEP_0113273628 /NCGR_PEP_ID=MMETSP0008_2-20120614/23954_1 /TAXON_ID=97485 /ORGANISM="Prymnesium parvum" /LENGTH=77 /DNA_ID=CAMNT_0000123161 /DNA_START=145 /DNA_END=378 /DNA_ORIENTATION=- /assembly_acc=CAM_ASM_000153
MRCCHSSVRKSELLADNAAKLHSEANASPLAVGNAARPKSTIAAPVGYVAGTLRRVAIAHPSETDLGTYYGRRYVTL